MRAIPIILIVTENFALVDEIPAGAATFDESYMDDESSEEDVTEVAAEDPNKFLVLCDGVLNSTSLLHESMNNFMSVKDTLLEHTLPPSVLLTLSITSSKLFRRFDTINHSYNYICLNVLSANYLFNNQ